MDLTDKMTALLTATVAPADQAQHDAEVARLKLDLAKAKVEGATNVEEDPLDEVEMRLPRGMHVEPSVPEPVSAQGLLPRLLLTRTLSPLRP